MESRAKKPAAAVEESDGVDLSLLLLNLSLSFEQRIEKHEDARELAEELRKAGTLAYEKSRQAS